jgi:hypothetical protein
MCCICFECRKRCLRNFSETHDNCCIQSENVQDSCFDSCEGCCQGFCGDFCDCPECSLNVVNARDRGGNVGKGLAKKLKTCFICINSFFWGCLTLFTSVYVLVLSTILLVILYVSYGIWAPLLQQQYNILMYAKIN